MSPLPLPALPLTPVSVPAVLAVLGIVLATGGSAGPPPPATRQLLRPPAATRTEWASSATEAAAPAVVRYQAPVPGPVRVLRPFQAPVGPYGAGHRGVDLAAGGPVRAAGAGVIAFAGTVAGRGVVVVRHPDGVRTEYEPVAPAVRPGQAVEAGQLIGVVAGRHPGCARGCLHWGARRGEGYFDPLRLLTPLGLVRLVPLT